MMKIYAENRQARFDYEILEEIEAGIELFGHEAKAIRTGRVTLPGGHIMIRNSTAFLHNIEIHPYQEKNTPSDYNPKRERRLILKKAEIEDLAKKAETKGLTIVPLLVYNIGKFIKVRIAVVRGKKTHDKRDTLKKRAVDRDIEREIRDR